MLAWWNRGEGDDGGGAGSVMPLSLLMLLPLRQTGPRVEEAARRGVVAAMRTKAALMLVLPRHSNPALVESRRPSYPVWLGMGRERGGWDA